MTAEEGNTQRRSRRRRRLSAILIPKGLDAAYASDLGNHLVVSLLLKIVLRMDSMESY